MSDDDSTYSADILIFRVSFSINNSVIKFDGWRGDESLILMGDEVIEEVMTH